MKDQRSSLANWVAALLVMSALAAFGSALLGKTVVDRPETFDIGNQWISFASFTAREYRAGHFPLWDPHDLCGMPFAAFLHTSALYPPHVAAHLAAPSYFSAHAALVFGHLMLAALGAAALLTGRGRGRSAAAAGAVVFAFSGFIFGNINFPPSLYSGAWLPALYAAHFSLLDRPRRGPLLFAALALAAMVLGGDLELTVYALLGLVFEAALRWRAGTLTKKSLIAAAAALALGLVLSLPGLLPALELSARSIRSGDFIPQIALLPLLAVPFYSLFQVPLPASLYPANHGLDPWYLGPVVLLFLFCALGRKESRRRLIIFPMAAIYLVLFYASPLNTLFSHVPVLGKMMVPLRMWPVLTLFLLLAATEAMDQWLKQSRDSDRPEVLPRGRGGAWFMIAYGILTAGSLYWIREAWAWRLIFVAALIGAGMVSLAGPARIRALLAQRRAALLLLLVVLDLYGLALGWLPRTDKARFQPDPRVASIIGNTSGHARYQIVSIRGILDPLLPYHLGLRLNADTIDAFSRVPPRDAARRLARLYPSLLKRRDGHLVQYDQMALRDPANLDLTQLSLFNELGVEYIMARHPQPKLQTLLDLELLIRDDDLVAYRNPHARPRASTGEASPAPLATANPAGDRIRLNPPPGFVGPIRLSDSWHPGWRARQDGGELKIESDELSLRKVRTKTDSSVVMTYEPASFRVGLWAGLAALVSLIGAGIIRRKTPSNL